MTCKVFQIGHALVKDVLCPSLFKRSLKLNIMDIRIQKNNLGVLLRVNQNGQPIGQKVLVAAFYHVLVNAGIVEGKGQVQEVFLTDGQRKSAALASTRTFNLESSRTLGIPPLIAGSPILDVRAVIDVIFRDAIFDHMPFLKPMILTTYRHDKQGINPCIYIYA